MDNTNKYPINSEEEKHKKESFESAIGDKQIETFSTVMPGEEAKPDTPPEPAPVPATPIPSASEMDKAKVEEKEIVLNSQESDFPEVDNSIGKD
jgi:hypothetical protein